MEQATLINLEQKYLQEMFTRNQLILDLYGQIEKLQAEVAQLKEVKQDGEN